MTNLESGLILLNKPIGITSFDALSEIKRCLGTGKVGHAGTLDKFAGGLLVVLVGKMTKFASFFEDNEKQYRAGILFGKETDTLDPEGAEVATGPIPSESEFRKILPEFLGDITQIPPAYSAIHVNGKRAYSMARRGESVELTARKVTIKNLQLIEWRDPVALVDVVCSKGTYIRALARDLGRALGSAASLESLVRTRIGRCSLTESVSPYDFDPARDMYSPSAAVMLAGIAVRRVRDSSRRVISHGGLLSDSMFTETTLDDGVYGIVDIEDNLCAVVERSGGEYSYRFVLK